MAIISNDDLGFGAPVQLYLRVDRITIEVRNNRVRFMLLGYPGRSAREKEISEGRNIRYLFNKEYEIKMDDIKVESFTPAGIKAGIYGYIKTLDEFSNSQDVKEIASKVVAKKKTKGDR